MNYPKVNISVIIDQVNKYNCCTLEALSAAFHASNPPSHHR